MTSLTPLLLSGVQLIPPDVYIEIERSLPEAMHVAQRMLDETLHMESKYARHMKQRRGTGDRTRMRGRGRGRRRNFQIMYGNYHRLALIHLPTHTCMTRIRPLVCCLLQSDAPVARTPFLPCRAFWV